MFVLSFPVFKTESSRKPTDISLTAWSDCPTLWRARQTAFFPQFRPHTKRSCQELMMSRLLSLGTQHCETQRHRRSSSAHLPRLSFTLRDLTPASPSCIGQSQLRVHTIRSIAAVPVLSTKRQKRVSKRVGQHVLPRI